MATHRLVDSRRVAFIGERAHELPQIWTADTRTGKLNQLTRHQSAITDYDITPDGSAWVYVARAQRQAEPRDYVEKGFVVDWPSQMLEKLVNGEHSPSPEDWYSDIYIGHTGSPNDRRVQQSTQWVLSLSIAPDGRHGIEMMQINTPPESWKQYDDPVLRQIVLGAGDKHHPIADSNLRQYFVIDGSSASIRPLSEAPGWGFLPALWSEDSREVILTQLFLPFYFPDAAKHSHNNVVSMSIDGGQPQLIRSENDQRWITPKEWNPHSKILILQQEGTAAYTVHQRIGNQWKDIQQQLASGLRLVVKEGINDPPELEAQEWSAEGIQRRTTISKLNPQLEELSLGRVNPLEWTGKDGLPWRGLMYFPPAYHTDKRYSLVIQTHGFSERTFEPDGRTTTAMAAQALANSDIIVVQLAGPKSGGVSLSPHYASQWVSGVEGLIDTLDEKKIVERNHVGLIGWSYTGWLVEYFLTHSGYPIGAAIAADNIEYSYQQYLIAANRGSIMAGFDAVYGGSPWEKPELWLKESPGFGLQRIRAPLRIEAESDSPLYHWELFAGLKVLHKPVELVVIPNGSHSLVRPWHRLTSQGGAVDWFRFWLKGEQDPDPGKQDQYVRWRELRRQQDASATLLGLPVLRSRTEWTGYGSSDFRVRWLLPEQSSCVSSKIKLACRISGLRTVAFWL